MITPQPLLYTENSKGTEIATQVISRCSGRSLAEIVRPLW
jgi:hypothetical protein